MEFQPRCRKVSSDCDQVYSVYKVLNYKHVGKTISVKSLLFKWIDSKYPRSLENFEERFLRFMFDKKDFKKSFPR